MTATLEAHETLPGPSRLAAIGIPAQFRKDPVAFWQNLQRSYGDKVLYYMGPQPVVLLTDPELIRNVLMRDHANFHKGRLLQIAKELLGEGLLTSEGELHAQQRHLIQPLFHRQMIQHYGEIMVDYAHKFRSRWQTGESLDMAAEMMRLTLGVVGKSLFDTDVEDEAPHVGKALSDVLTVMELIGRPLLMMLHRTKLPTPRRQRTLAARDVLDETIYKIIAQRRANPSESPNLIAMLMQARTEDGSGMSDQQIRDEALTLFLAGHETTANALAWTWYLLSQHPRVEACLHAELDTVLGGRRATFEDLNHLPYTRQVLTESMRLYPPAWVIARKALEAYQLTPRYRIPAGTVVILPQFLMHRDARYYTEPERFWPERWDNDLRKRNPKYAYFPFGGGPRNCIGEAFAWMEGILLLATLAQQWRFQLKPGHQVERQHLLTLRPLNGLPMTAIPR